MKTTKFFLSIFTIALYCSCARVDGPSENDHLSNKQKVDTVQVFKKAIGGMLYNIHIDMQGTKIKAGDFVAFKTLEKTEEDSILYSSYDYDRPSLLMVDKSVFQGDLFDALKLLSEGDSATFKINADSMVAKMNRPKLSDPLASFLVYAIKVDKVIHKGRLTDEKFRAVIDEYLQLELKKKKKGEPVLIKSFMRNKGLIPKTTPSGLNYIITRQGQGTKANLGDTLEVHYTGMFLSGKIFDTSLIEVAKRLGTFNKEREYSSLKLISGNQSSIPGFEEGVMLLPKGAKATLVLPSSLAYGEEGNQGIPPYTPLIFEVDIIDIRRQLN